MIINLEDIRNFFKNDRFATENGIIIESVSEESVVCSLELNESHQNAADGIHGGVIFTLADFAFAVHCNLAMVCGENVGITVGQSASISFLKGTRGKKLMAKSECISKGRKISVYRITILDDLGVHIAEILANSFSTDKIK